MNDMIRAPIWLVVAVPLSLLLLGTCVPSSQSPPKPPVEVRYVTNRANHTEKQLAQQEKLARQELAAAELVINSQAALILSMKIQLRQAEKERDLFEEIPNELAEDFTRLKDERDYWKSAARALSMDSDQKLIPFLIP